MSIISGFQKVKKYIKTAGGYQLLSHWTSANTVEMNDGTTLESKICNIDNTSDQDKPISSAQQYALNQKADIVSPSFSGTPTAPTPLPRTNTDQIATTAFVQTVFNEGISVSIPPASAALPKANGSATAGTDDSYARGDHIHPLQESVTGSSGRCLGNAATATKLETARTIQTNLENTSATSFNGTKNITPGITGTLPIANGGTGKKTLTANQVLIGNGTGAITQRAIDTTTGGTASSTSLITSGAVNAGLNKKIGSSDFLFFSQQKSYTGSNGTSTESITIANGYKAVYVEAHMLDGLVNNSTSWDCYVKSFSQSGTTVNITLSGSYFGAISISALCVKG